MTYPNLASIKEWMLIRCWRRKKMAQSKKTSITLGEHFEKIIKSSIESGRYASANEVIRAGLRLVDEKEQKIRLLREAIEAGEKRGYVQDFDPVKHLADLHSKIRK